MGSSLRPLWLAAGLLAALALPATSYGYAALTHVLVSHHGAEGAVQAFAINYSLYFVLLVVIFRRLLFRRPAAA